MSKQVVFHQCARYKMVYVPAEQRYIVYNVIGDYVYSGKTFCAAMSWIEKQKEI